MCLRIYSDFSHDLLFDLFVIWMCFSLQGVCGFSIFPLILICSSILINGWNFLLIYNVLLFSCKNFWLKVYFVQYYFGHLNSNLVIICIIFILSLFTYLSLCIWSQCHVHSMELDHVFLIDNVNLFLLIGRFNPLTLLFHIVIHIAITIKEGLPPTCYLISVCSSSPP